MKRCTQRLPAPSEHEHKWRIVPKTLFYHNHTVFNAPQTEWMGKVKETMLVHENGSKIWCRFQHSPLKGGQLIAWNNACECGTPAQCFARLIHQYGIIPKMNFLSHKPVVGFKEVSHNFQGIDHIFQLNNLQTPQNELIFDIWYFKQLLFKHSKIRI